MLTGSDGPVIPERTSVRTSSNPPKHDPGRRRRSLPATSFRNDRRRDPNRVTVNPASTEVISSLIETLSAISSPAEQHFDSLPKITASRSTPVSPRPWQAEHPIITQSFSKEAHQATHVNTSKRPHGVDATYLLHPNHLSTRPSASKPSPANPERTLQREPEDPFDLGEIYSIGNVSIEAKPCQSLTSIAPTESSTQKGIRSIRSIRSLKTLALKSSRDSIRSADEKVVRKSGREREGKPGRLVTEDSTPPQSPFLDAVKIAKRSPRHAVVSKTLETLLPPEHASSVPFHSHSKRLYWNADDIESDAKNTYSIPNQDCIPTRHSSKRHSMKMNNIHQQSSRSSDTAGSCEGQSSSVQKGHAILQQTLQEIAKEGNNGDEPWHEAAEDFVTRRIKELKEQKLQRERLSLDNRSDFLSAPRTPNRSLSPSSEPAPSQLASPCFREVEGELLHGGVSQSQEAVDPEQSAPSPAIASRTKRSSVIVSSPLRDPLAPQGNENKRRSFTAPHRSNSRLLRRISRPTSPTTPAKHKRTLSNAPNEPLYDQFEKGDTDSIGNAVDDFLTSPRLNQKIKHAHTGRLISFSEVGDPHGSVVFCCVGMGLTRFLTAFYDELASTLRLRLITPDRPGVGGSEPHADGLDSPLGWPDDVRAICEHLKITKFSIMAHSAGAIYALATALRMSQHIRCRVHLLAPWIPPSQMSTIGTQQEPLPTSALPYSQRLLRALPATFLRAANSTFLSTTSASISTSLPKSPRRNKGKSNRSETPGPDLDDTRSESSPAMSASLGVYRSRIDEDYSKENRPPLVTRSTSGKPIPHIVNEQGRKSSYETRLTEAIWEAATTGANPAVDLIVCLERRQAIGFRYVDITRAVVIHQGSKDTRVPVENVKWLGKTMRRCQVRILEGEGHGLMASATVMGNVLMEIAQEWDDWNRVVKGGIERRVTTAT
ncbi:hypothetical protein ACLMJK_004194 [Lecanora helva]